MATTSGLDTATVVPMRANASRCEAYTGNSVSIVGMTSAISFAQQNVEQRRDEVGGGAPRYEERSIRSLEPCGESRHIRGHHLPGQPKFCERTTEDL